MGEKMAKIERFVHREVNDRRRSSGEDNLRGHPQLIEAAQDHARDMARRGFYGHTNPDGESVGDRVPGRVVSENIAKVYDNGHHPRGVGAKAAEQWAESSGHRRNMLNNSYRWSGVGAWPRDEWVFIVQTYAEPCPELGGDGRRGIPASIFNR
jgi:uncharacterized protein YkwD